MTIQLYCFGESGNSYKAALALELSRLDWEPVFVDFFNGETRTPEFHALNVLGEVPVMVDGDLVLSQSGAIQYHIVRDHKTFMGKTYADTREVMRWVFFDNHKVSGLAGTLRYNLNFLPEAKRSEDVNNFLLMRLKSALKAMDAHLESRDWLVSDYPTMGDLSCCGYLFYPEPFGFDRANYPNIDRWLGNIAALPGWKHPYDLMPGSPADRA